MNYFTLRLLIILIFGFSPLAAYPDDGASVAAEKLKEKSQELRRLRDEIEEIKKNYPQNTPKTIYLTRTKLTKPYYAEYHQAVKNKLERLGKLNFPPAALELQKPTRVKASIKIKYDGSLLEVKLLRYSGHKEIDDAVIRIARLAAPYEPFPEELKQEAEVVVFLDDWQFVPRNETSAPVPESVKN